MVRLEKIYYGYDEKPILKGMSLSIQKGKITTVFGPSGCGKSTVLKVIAGLLKPQSGEVYIDGRPSVDIKPEKRQVGFVFQKPLLFPHMTVADNIGFPMSVEDKSKRESRETIQQSIRQWLSVFQLESLAERFPGELSGGQAQRVAVARAIASKPRLLLMDEPFSALDIRARQDMNDWLIRIQKELGITVLFVTHDVDECLRLSEEVILMDGDGIVQQGGPDQVYYHPVNERAARLMGMYNCIDDPLAHRWHIKSGAIVRPDMITLEVADDGPWVCSAIHAQGMTKRYELTDKTHRLYVDCLGEQCIDIGQRCRASLSTTIKHI